MARHTHGNPTIAGEFQSYFADFTNGYVVAGGIHNTSGNTTAMISACQAYISQLGPPRRLRYVEEISDRSITYAAGNGIYWTIMHTGLTTAVSGWTRVTGTHYLYQLSATEPVIPNRAILLLRTVVAATIISEILDYRHRVIGIDTAETFSYTTSARSQWTFLQGGKLIPASGVTISHVGKINAGFYQIFDLSSGGFIKFPRGSSVCAEWWGAKSDGVTNSGAAIHSALNANPTKMHVQLQEGTYIVESSITPPMALNSDWSLSGKGQRKTTLKRSTGFIGNILTIGNGSTQNNRFTLQSFGIDGIDKAPGVVGIRVLRSGQGQYKDIVVLNCYRGIWISGGSYHTITQAYCELNIIGITFDNESTLALTIASLQDSFFRNNPINCLIDGTAAPTKLIRNITITHCTFENDALTSAGNAIHSTALAVDDTTTGNCGIKIVQSQQIHVHECWFEDNCFHVKIEGGVIAKKCSAITFSGCQYGNHHSTHLTPESFLWDGVAPIVGDPNLDGYGSSMRACVLTEGVFQFNQTVKILLEDNDVAGSASLGGTSWYQTYGTDNEGINYGENPTTKNWRPGLVYKNTGTIVSERGEMVSTEDTTNATVTTVAARSLKTGSTAFVACRAVARSADNFINAAYEVAALVAVTGGASPPTDADPGVAAIIAPGMQTLMTPLENSAGMAFILDVTGGPSGPGTNQIRARATGVAATTITWEMDWKILRLITP